MATPGYGQAADQTSALKASVKQLTVSELKNILRKEGLTVSGVKSELQVRLISCTLLLHRSPPATSLRDISNPSS